MLHRGPVPAAVRLSDGLGISNRISARFVLLAKVPNGDRQWVITVLINEAHHLPGELLKSLTWDRGICMHRKKINISHVLAGQKLGIKEVDDGIWLVSFMHYDLGYIDLEQRTLQILDNPFGPRLSPM
ncbi:MAG: hypothetical protein ACJ8E0_11090 [Sphingomicrobium sp.]